MKPQTDHFLHALSQRLYSAAEFLRDRTHIGIDIIDEPRYLAELLLLARLAVHRAKQIERHLIAKGGAE